MRHEPALAHLREYIQFQFPTFYYYLQAICWRGVIRSGDMKLQLERSPDFDFAEPRALENFKACAKGTELKCALYPDKVIRHNPLNV
jgi:site-specific DNA-adenine methylase